MLFEPFPNQEAAKFLVSHGADIQHMVGADLLTPIDVAKKKNHNSSLIEERPYGSWVF